jgi:hypothetical protein
LGIAYGHPASAAARSFGTPQALTAKGYAGLIGLGVDSAGNGLMAWTDAGSYYSTRPAGGAWSAPASLYVGGGTPIMHTLASGSATIVSWSQVGGIWSIDYTPGGSWTAPYLIVNAPDIVTGTRTRAPQVEFVEDARGDQIVVFEEYVAGGTAIVAIRRPAGGTWGPQETVATSAAYGNISLAGSAIGGNGDAIVAFEPFATVCSVRYCNEVNFTVHVARENARATKWRDSGALTPVSSEYYVETVMDAAGRAGLLVQNDFYAPISASTQGPLGGAWSPFVTAFADPGNDAVVWGQGTFGANGASIAFTAFGTPGAEAVLDGSLATNAWPALTLVSASDTQSVQDALSFTESGNGSAIAEWPDADFSMRVATRPGIGRPWTTPVTIAPGGACNVGGYLCSSPAGVAINAKGDALAAYIQTDSSATYHYLYVANTE